MKLNWLRAASLALAASAGLPLVALPQLASAQSPAYHLSDDGEVAELESADIEPAEGERVAPAAYNYSHATPARAAAYRNSAAYTNAAMLGGQPCDACAEEEAAEEEACEPWRLFCQKECGINVYGWVSGGIMGNTQSPASKFNGPTTFADQWNGQGNQAYAIAEKTIDTGGCGWDIGGRVDLLYGSDYIFTQASGLETTDDFLPKWNSNPDYGLALPQAYVEVGYNNLSVKGGHFYTPIGYEVVPATGNFFYTHAYTMQYGEPFTHTGGIATWKLDDSLSVVGAVVNGWDALDRVDDAAMIIAGFSWNNGDDLAVAYNFGFSNDEFTLGGELTNRNISSLVVTYTRGDWTYVFQNDVGWQLDGNPYANFQQSAEWYGVNQYLFYTINDCWRAGLRAEWFRDDDGVRVGGIRPGNPLPVAAVDPSFAGNFYEITAGLNWTPHANITVRPEIRYDWYDGEEAPGGIRPFDDGSRTDQFLYGLDVIVLW
jgi:hypothetical protein